MRSQTILVVARIGAERIAPGTPHSQNQNTKDKITRTGLSVKRLARSIGVAGLAFDQVNGAVERRGKQGLPSRSDGQQAGEQEDDDAGDGAEDRGEIFIKSATVPHRTGSPTSVAHMTKAVATPTSPFMRVIVMR